ncbi:putative zinc finger protein [Acorus calamus]|uniref:Zinc finger protein n=1 Tax=Acorus calamus TaxID=4465 RepID=A0AAV9FD18_ACOCL|nr:putative zinc finger protein [Acorus calamus]
MDLQASHLFEKRPIIKDKSPAVRWFKEWVPQDLVATGGRCSIMKWVTEDMLKAIKEKCKEPEQEEPEPEPTTELLFLCSYEGCGKSFIDAGALRKHSHIHGERQYVCHYDNCGKKFLDSSKLKRHWLIHTGERDYVCPHEGCGKAFSLDFNLRAHMKTHSQENYHICPYEDCGKRYAHEYKLKAHIKSHHEKNVPMDVIKQPVMEKVHHTPKPPPAVYGPASSERPYACPYEGCGKCYIHEYKLNLHLKKEHPNHNSEENGKHAPNNEHEGEEASDQDAYVARGSNGKSFKRSKPSSTTKMPPSKSAKKKVSNLAPTNLNVVKKPWPSEMTYEEDSEETEEDRENVEEDGWDAHDGNEDDEETEDED